MVFAPDELIDVDRADALELIAAGAAVSADENESEAVEEPDQTKATKSKKG